MKIAIISDIHVKKTDEESYGFLMRFMSEKKVLESDFIIFLGDIFDLMVGGHKEYIEYYSDFFEALKTLLMANKKVFFFEGNHDFHLRDLFSYFLEKNGLDKGLFSYLSEGISLKVGEKNYYFSHGDDIELGNYSYKVYKSIVRSRLLKMVANDFFSFSFMERLGSKVSENSKQRNFKKYKENNFDKVIKEKFIRSAEAFYKKSLPQKKYDYIVCGHSHQKEFYKSQEGFYYLNNGFALKTKTFIFIENHSPEFIKLM